MFITSRFYETAAYTRRIKNIKNEQVYEADKNWSVDVVDTREFDWPSSRVAYRIDVRYLQRPTPLVTQSIHYHRYFSSNPMTDR